MNSTLRYGAFLIHHEDVVGSTNDHLRALAEAADQPELTCVTASRQTAGRGRMARSWHSAPGEGLYLSILLRPPVGAPGIPLISLMTAVAGAETLIRLGLERVDIKWPNDLLVGERKIGGILTESFGYGSGTSLNLIVGIGINLNHRHFPPPLDETATSYQIESGGAIDVDSFRNCLLDSFGGWYRRWQSGELSAVRTRWQELSSYGRGREVVVELDSTRPSPTKLTGVTVGIDENGALLLRTADGALRTILSGEISRLRNNRHSA